MLSIQNGTVTQITTPTMTMIILSLRQLSGIRSRKSLVASVQPVVAMIKGNYTVDELLQICKEHPDSNGKINFTLEVGALRRGNLTDFLKNLAHMKNLKIQIAESKG